MSEQVEESWDHNLVHTISSSCVSVFKVIGSESSIVEYFQHANASSTPDSDWSAMYFQFSAEHAIGTLGYRWDKGYKLATMIRIDISALDVVVAAGDVFSNHLVTGNEKAALLKQHLHIDKSQMLMNALGERNVCLCCQESATEWELIVPHSLLATMRFREHLLYQYQANAFGGTAYMRHGTNDGEWGPWERFVEPDANVSLPPVEWIS